MEEQKKNSRALIVVILIVVVLILGILGCMGACCAGMFVPQYLRYQQKAYQAGDMMKINEVFIAAEAVASDPAYGVTETYFLVEVDRYGIITVTDASGNEMDQMKKEICQLAGFSTVDLKSEQYQNITSCCSFTYTSDPSGGGHWTKQEYSY